MGALIRQVYSATPLTVWGLVLFFVLFLALVAWVFLRKGAKQEYQEIAQLPLRAEEQL